MRRTLALSLLLLAVGLMPAATQAGAEVRHTTHAALRGRASEVPKDVPGAWWATVQKDVEASEYQVTRNVRAALPGDPAEHQAANRAHNLRTHFTRQGARLVARSEAAPAWSVSLGLAAKIGRAHV